MEDYICIQRINDVEANIDSFRHQLFCNYMGKDNLEREVWFKPNSLEFAVLIDGKTYVELKLRGGKNYLNAFDYAENAFDYVEATIDRSKQMITYDKDTFFNLMDEAIANGAKYPAIQSTLGKEKGRIARFVQSLLPQKPLTPELKENLRHAYEIRVIDPDYRFEEEEYGALTPERVPVKGLPDGWVWEHYDDASGNLRSPDGQRYYEYDRQPYHPYGIEYKATPSSQWGNFWGSFEEFQEHAESCIQMQLERESSLAQERAQVQEQTQSLEETMEQEM